MIARKQGRKMGKSGGAPVAAPVLRLRELAVGIVCIALLIVWPLFMVAKQIFITNLSVRESALADSLAAVGRQCATQRLYNEKLSSTARIESIMREHRGLEYPAAGQIVVIREPGRSNFDRQNPSKFFAIIKKPFSREKG
jgi:hypothetical protein